jgi:hypothetical protein
VAAESASLILVLTRRCLSAQSNSVSPVNEIDCFSAAGS